MVFPKTKMHSLQTFQKTTPSSNNNNHFNHSHSHSHMGSMNKIMDIDHASCGGNSGFDLLFAASQLSVSADPTVAAPAAISTTNALFSPAGVVVDSAVRTADDDDDDAMTAFTALADANTHAHAAAPLASASILTTTSAAAAGPPSPSISTAVPTKFGSGHGNSSIGGGSSNNDNGGSNSNITRSKKYTPPHNDCCTVVSANTAEYDDATHSTTNTNNDVATLHHSKNSSQKTFPQILHEMLSHSPSSDNDHSNINTDTASIISWLPNGQAFVIHKPRAFATKILPKYFRKTRLSSFIRKLNRWGFRRIKQVGGNGDGSSSCGDNEGGGGMEMMQSAFAHKYFLRENPNLCVKMFCRSKPCLIKTTTPTTSIASSSRATASTTTTSAAANAGGSPRGCVRSTPSPMNMEPYYGLPSSSSLSHHQQQHQVHQEEGEEEEEEVVGVPQEHHQQQQQVAIMIDNNNNNNNNNNMSTAHPPFTRNVTNINNNITNINNNYNNDNSINNHNHNNNIYLQIKMMQHHAQHQQRIMHRQLITGQHPILIMKSLTTATAANNNNNNNFHSNNNIIIGSSKLLLQRQMRLNMASQRSRELLRRSHIYLNNMNMNMNR